MIPRLFNVYFKIIYLFYFIVCKILRSSEQLKILMETQPLFVTAINTQLRRCLYFPYYVI